MEEVLETRIKQAIRDVKDFPKKGILFKDITPIFLNANLTRDIVDEMAKRIHSNIDIICGIESRGFLFGILLAQKLEKPFVMIRKAGKLPAEKIAVQYKLEYGEAIIEMHKGFIQPNQRVLIHDDLLATGGTALAASELIRQQQGIVEQYSFLVELSFLKGQELLKTVSNQIDSLVIY